MNWPVIIIVSIVALALIFFINIRNQKDKKDLTRTLNNDYPKTKDEEGDSPADDDLPK